MIQNGWAAMRCCREDTSLTVYEYLQVRCGTANTTSNRCWNCPKTRYVEIKEEPIRVEDGPEKVVRAKNRREQLAKLPHNRKKMRY